MRFGFGAQAKDAAQQAAARVRAEDEKRGFTKTIKANATALWASIDEVSEE